MEEEPNQFLKKTREEVPSRFFLQSKRVTSVGTRGRKGTKS